MRRMSCLCAARKGLAGIYNPYWLAAVFARFPNANRATSLENALTRKIFWLELNRQTVRRSVRGVIPGISISMQRLGGGEALCGDKPFQRTEPMAVIGFPRIGIACCLCAFDFLGEGGGPFVPGEQSTLVKRE